MSIRLSRVENMVYSYILGTSFKSYADSFLHLVSLKKVSGAKFKKMHSYVKMGESKMLKELLIDSFNQFEVPYVADIQKFNARLRQDAYRARNKNNNKKQINFYIDADLYELILDMKKSLNFTYPELMEYFISNLKK